MEEVYSQRNSNVNAFLVGLAIGAIATYLITTAKGRRIARAGVERIFRIGERLENTY